MIERRAESSMHNYISAADVLADFVEYSEGAKLPAGARGAWRELMALIRSTDDLIDNTSDAHERTNLYDFVLDSLVDKQPAVFSTQLEDIVKSIKDNIMKDMTSVQRELFVITLGGIFDATERIKVATDGRNLAFLTRLEGQLTMRLLLLCLPENFCSRNTNILITRFCRFANNVDSTFDMPRDSRRGEISCKPTLTNMYRMFIQPTPDILSFAAKMRPGWRQLTQMIDFGWRTISGRNR